MERRMNATGSCTSVENTYSVIALASLRRWHPTGRAFSVENTYSIIALAPQ